MYLQDLFDTKVVLTRRNADSTAVEGFIDEYHALTHAHPFTRGMRYFTDGPVMVDVVPDEDFPNQVELRDIQSRTTKGSGAKALNVLCALADKYKVSIFLCAMGYDQIPTKKLVEYYCRFGFQPLQNLDYVQWDVEGVSVDMKRLPH